MNQALYDDLVNRAKRGKIALYREVQHHAGLDMDIPADREEIGRLLGEISEYEHQQGRPLLSAIVIAKGEGRPGRGFFNFIRSKGLLQADDEDSFWAMEIARVFREWDSLK
jgi:hypothetical protein